MSSIPDNNRKDPKKRKAGYDEYKPFLRFTLFSLASIVVILFVAGLELRHILRDLIISGAERDAIQASAMARDCEIRKYVDQHHDENGRVLDIPLSDLPLADDAMKVFTESFDIVKIKIYNVEHRIIYSTDPNLIGRTDRHNNLLLTALAGIPVSEYQSQKQLWDFEDEKVVNAEIAETYVPIYGHDGKIIGSFEIYKDISRDLAMLHAILFRSWSILAITVLGVFAAFMFVIRHAERTIKQSSRNVAETNKQLQQEIEDRKSLEKELLSVIERERQRIGQELHDSIGQQLAGIIFMAEVLRSKLRHKSLANEITFAERISIHVNQVAQQTRNLAGGLHPIDIDRIGLISSLEELLVNTEQLFNISCALESDSRIEPTDSAVAINLYRIVQEAITNAIKHGKARNVRISLAAKNGRSELSVENDGMAFSSSRNHSRGMGLRIMCYRAE
jgi:signal transduction histidine kinase